MLCRPLLPIAALACLAPTARAAGVSADSQLVHPTFARGSVPGVDSPLLDETGTVRVGTLVMYEQDPLILYRDDTELGAVVHHRDTAHLGISYDFASIASARIVLPVAYQWGSEVPQRSADGGAMGDLGLGLRIRAVDSGPVVLGAWCDLLVSSGTTQAWVSEDATRLSAGTLLRVDAGPAAVMADLGFMGRAAVDTGDDLALGRELLTSIAVGGWAVPERAWPHLDLVRRTGSGTVPSDNPSELLAGVQLTPDDRLVVDLGVGRGLSAGYGTTAVRAFAGLTWVHPPKPDAPAPEPVAQREIVYVAPEVDALDKQLGLETEEETWQEGELARRKGDHIVIRDDIKFEVGTVKVLPESRPTLQYVAGLLNSNGQIAQLVIVGHASEEGEFAPNYQLSLQRAMGIYEELLMAGVHPDRLSVRAMGETAPMKSGSLASQRRVEFLVARELDPLEPEPVYDPNVVLPWSGEKVDPRQPSQVKLPVEEADAPMRPREEKLQVDFGEEDELEIEGVHGQRAGEDRGEDKADEADEKTKDGTEDPDGAPGEGEDLKDLEDAP